MDGIAASLEPMSGEDAAESPSPWTPTDGPQAVPPTGEAPDAARGESSAPAGEDAEASITPAQIVEALLFASDVPLPPAKIARALGVGGVRDVRQHVEALNERYAATGSAVRIQEIGGGYQIRTLPVFHTWLARLNKARQETKLSAAAMETLAIVAYKQPATRAHIEAIRGVAAGDMLNRLRELDLVRITGRAEDLGRPMLYGTTKRFLEVFGLGGLDDLPQIEGPPDLMALRPVAEALAAEESSESHAPEDADDHSVADTNDVGDDD